MSDSAGPRHDVALRWLATAEADLLEARLNLKHGGAPHIACYHAQQAAEKAIKAAYVRRGIAFERIHDLDRLRGRLPGEWTFKTQFPDLSSLTVWAVQGRYPGDWPEATAEEAAEALRSAEAIVESVRADIERNLA